jgi:putative membrane protein
MRLVNLAVCFAATLLFATFSSGGEAFAQYGGYGGYHMWPGMMGGWGMGWFGGIFMIVFWVAVIVGVVFLIRWLFVSSRTGAQGPGHGGDTALDILRKRYARGEIDKQEFEEKKKDLLA